MGEVFGAKTPPMPTRNVGAFRFLCPPSRQDDSRPLRVCQSCRFCSPLGHSGSQTLRVCQPGPCLESDSLILPLAALRRIPRNRLAASATGGALPVSPHPLTTQRQGVVNPRLWKPPPGNRFRQSSDGCAVHRHLKNCVPPFGAAHIAGVLIGSALPVILPDLRCSCCRGTQTEVRLCVPAP